MSWIDTYRTFTSPPTAPALQPGQSSPASRTQTEELVFTTGARLVQSWPLFEGRPDHFSLEDHGHTQELAGHFQYHASVNGLPERVQVFSGDSNTVQEIFGDECVGLTVTLPGQKSADPFYLTTDDSPNAFRNPEWLRSAQVSPGIPGTVELRTSARQLELGLLVPWNVFGGEEPGRAR